MQSFKNNNVSQQQAKKIDLGQQKIIENYINERCKRDFNLKESIEKSKKTIQGAYNFVYKELEKEVKNCGYNSAMCENDYVFNLVVHYFLEDSLNCETKKDSVEKSSNSVEEEDYCEDLNTTKKQVESKKTSKNQKTDNVPKGQISFDFELDDEDDEDFCEL